MRSVWIQPSSAREVPLDVRKVIARRSLLEFGRGEIANLGFGISQNIGAIAQEEDVADLLVLTVEQGVFGGVPASGNDGGAGFNYQALIDQPYMFDFYDGGGIDIASLSFAEVDRLGNVNVHAFGERLRGPGGFPNISRGAKKVCFVGTLTTGGMKAVIEGGTVEITTEGTTERFVDQVKEITFSGPEAAERGQEVRYITERAVFALIEGTVTMIEIAEGLDPETDVIAHMGFRPAISPNLSTIDPAVFSTGTMGLREATRECGSMSTDLVTVEIGAVTIIRLNNPPLNLVSLDVTKALTAALARIEQDKEVRAVILAGTGNRAFCAGSDVKEFPSLAGRVAEGKLISENAMYNRLAELPVPTIAAIEGNALGGGLELALCCDLRVAASTALLGLPEVRLGVMPGSGGTQRLPRLIGLARAKELILLGEVIDAETALSFGLVNRVVEEGQAESAALELAETLASRGPVAVREAKAVLNTTLDGSLSEGQASELEASERVFSSEDMLEGAAAFVEKRVARFRNR